MTVKLTETEFKLYNKVEAEFQSALHNISSAIWDFTQEVEKSTKDEIPETYDDEAYDAAEEERSERSGLWCKVYELDPEEFLRDRLMDLNNLASKYKLDQSATPPAE